MVHGVVGLVEGGSAGGGVFGGGGDESGVIKCDFLHNPGQIDKSS